MYYATRPHTVAQRSEAVLSDVVVELVSVELRTIPVQRLSVSCFAARFPERFMTVFGLFFFRGSFFTSFGKPLRVDRLPAYCVGIIRNRRAFFYDRRRNVQSFLRIPRRVKVPARNTSSAVVSHTAVSKFESCSK